MSWIQKGSEREKPNTSTSPYICVDNPNSISVQRREHIIHFPAVRQKALHQNKRQLKGNKDEKVAQKNPKLCKSTVEESVQLLQSICSTIYSKSVTKANPHEIGLDMWRVSSKILQLTSEPPLCIFQVLLHLFLRMIGTYHRRCYQRVGSKFWRTLGKSCKRSDAEITTKYTTTV